MLMNHLTELNITGLGANYSLINANALIMHSFFPVIQGNGKFTSFCITSMLIQCITFVKIHCITLNYCLTEVLPYGYRRYIRELDPQPKG